LAAMISNVTAWAVQLEGSFTSQYYDAVLAVQTICGNLDIQPDMQTPLVWPVINSLHDVWLSAIKLSQQQSQAGVQMQTWTNPTTQSVADIAAALYGGDTSQIGAILGLNTFPDPNRVRAGTSVNYFPAR
jgi:hypothetical protein